MNPEIAASLGETAYKRDSYRRDSQQLAGSALTVIGAVLTKCSQEEESIDKIELLEFLFDAAKLIADLHYKQTECRKAFIVPGMSKDVKTILQSTAAGEMLFGDKIGEKIKEARLMEKTGQTLRTQTPFSSQPSSSTRQNLNFRGRWGTRPFPHNRAYTNSSGQAKPRLFFRKRNKPNTDRTSQRPFGQRNQRSRLQSRYR